MGITPLQRQQSWATAKGADREGCYVSISNFMLVASISILQNSASVEGNSELACWPQGSVQERHHTVRGIPVGQRSRLAGAVMIDLTLLKRSVHSCKLLLL